jgi:hypothetical protein
MSSSFTDSWVVDRTLFDHAALGRCECCGGGVAMMAQSPLVLELCTDLGTWGAGGCVTCRLDRFDWLLHFFLPCIRHFTIQTRTTGAKMRWPPSHRA